MKVIKILAALLLTLLLIIAGLLVYIDFSTRLPDTKGMEEYYSQHKELFSERTAEIILSLKAGREIDTNRRDEIGYFRVDAALEPSVLVKYYTHQRGFSVGAYGNGIAYLEMPPARLYGSLQQMVEDSRAVEGFEGFGRLSANWYYFRWELD